MQMVESVPGYDALHFQLVDNAPASDLRILCLTSDEQDKATWVEVITRQFLQQKDLLAGQ